MSDDENETPCRTCADGAGVSTRRAFLQMAACFTVSAAALGLSASDADALPVAFAEGVASGSEHRYPIPASDGVTIDKVTQVIIVRYQAHAYAFNLACPHQNQMLRWLPKEGRFQCPKHESKYQPNGTFIDGRATRHMDRLAIRVDGGSLVVDVDKMFQSDKDLGGWTAATVTI
jgi:nitrite reductase/ring-hydroxylating ferredoxin subunit